MGIVQNFDPWPNVLFVSFHLVAERCVGRESRFCQLFAMIMRFVALRLGHVPKQRLEFWQSASLSPTICFRPVQRRQGTVDKASVEQRLAAIDVSTRESF